MSNDHPFSRWQSRATNNPHLHVISNAKTLKEWDDGLINAALNMCRQRGTSSVDILEVGGKDHAEARLRHIKHINYCSLNLYLMDKESKRSDVMLGDICKTVDTERRFDMVVSRNTFEHLLEPWAAASEMVRLLRPGGYVVVYAPFSWRYHPTPIDCFRYTHTGIQYLFERHGGVERVIAGYTTDGHVSGFWNNRLDHTVLHGNNVPEEADSVMYIGQKVGDHPFRLGQLDVHEYYAMYGKPPHAPR